ncbi:uncharacterized protein LOC103514307 [Diaphorina citri]|uniref:Uncharacterized protein LOC103514307 n=1 Tax=Diaphorina citri TaxID=121845 RepID=A0A1S3D9Q2_DIACI|nr:uncharacterized protein LOC103514307 [Diaphorina citri]
MAANSVPSGCTGRGRGVVSKSVEPPGLARGRGRGVGDAPAENPVPGVGSLKINGDGNGYDTDARTALETVTEKPGNMSEVTTVLNKWLDLAEANEDIGEAVARSACELMAHGEYGDKIREITLGRIFQMFKVLLPLPLQRKLLPPQNKISFSQIVTKKVLLPLPLQRKLLPPQNKISFSH